MPPKGSTKRGRKTPAAKRNRKSTAKAGDGPPSFNARELRMLYYALQCMDGEMEINETTFSKLTAVSQDSAKETWLALREKIMAEAAKTAIPIPTTNRETIAGRSGRKVRKSAPRTAKRKRAVSSSEPSEEEIDFEALEDDENEESPRMRMKARSQSSEEVVDESDEDDAEADEDDADTEEDDAEADEDDAEADEDDAEADEDDAEADEDDAEADEDDAGVDENGIGAEDDDGKPREEPNKNGSGNNKAKEIKPEPSEVDGEADAFDPGVSKQVNKGAPKMVYEVAPKEVDGEAAKKVDDQAQKKDEVTSEAEPLSEEA